MNRSLLATTIAAALLAACTSNAATLPSQTQTAGSATVTFAVAVRAPSAQSIVVYLAGTSLLTANVAASSASCRVTGTLRRCSVRAAVPTGHNTLGVVAYDRTGGVGNVLAAGDVPVDVTSGSAQHVRLSLTGKPASIALSIALQYPPAGRAMRTAVTLLALDADGNTIVGSYGAPIALTNGDESGATKLSAASVSDSATAVTLSYDGTTLASAMLTAKAAGLATAHAPFAPSPTTVLQYDAPNVRTAHGLQPAGFSDISLGPDGRYWLADSYANAITRVDAGGTFTSFAIPLNALPMGISAGSDGRLWFAESNAGRIGAIDTSGKIVSYRVPVPNGGISQPSWTMLGPDGRTWFLDQGLDAAGTIDANGKMVLYPLPKYSAPIEMVAGPDGNLWITDGGLNTLIVLSPSGKVVATHALALGTGPYGIAVGPDKNLWFTEYGAGRIGRMTTGGVLTEFATPTAQSGPVEITSGPDGNIWFTEAGGGLWDYAGKIAYIKPDGSLVREYAAGTGLGSAHALIFDKSGALWYTKLTGSSSALNELMY